MRNRRLKYAVGLGIIIAAFSYIVYSSLSSHFRYSTSPSELAEVRAKYNGKVINLAGVVAPGSIAYESSDYRFAITDGKASVAVHYRGTVPNTFDDGADVVATGLFDADNNSLAAKRVITKCASKYAPQQE